MWDHVSGNGERAAHAVADCDVLAIEYTGFRSDEERERFDTAATICVSDGVSGSDMRKAQRVLRRTSTAVAELLLLLKGSDKRILTIDANRGEPALKEFDEGSRLLERAGRSAHRVPNTRTEELLDEAARKMGRGNAGREAIDVEQLQEIASSYEGRDVKIAVLIGANHTPVLHDLAKHYPTERRHAYGRYVGQSNQESAYYDPTEQMRRHHNFFPDKPVPKVLIDRAIVHMIRLAAVERGAVSSGASRARRLENVSDEEISKMVLALDGMKSGVRARLQPKRTLANMDAAIERKLLEVEGGANGSLGTE